MKEKKVAKMRISESEKRRTQKRPPFRCLRLLAQEALAVSALIDRRIGFVGADGDAVQRTVGCAVAVVGALLDGAVDGLVAVRMIHGGSSFLFRVFYR